MKSSRPDLPFRYQVINTLGRLLVAGNVGFTRLDEQSLCETAMNQTGLTDFGDPYYRQGLQQLLDSAEGDANLHMLGRFIVNNMVTMYLVQRLLMTKAQSDQPEIFSTPLVPPLIICGPARSGTTFLHKLLALDATHRGLPQWLLMRPFPEEPRQEQGIDPRYLKAEQGLRMREPMLPGMDSKHYTRADSAEECIVVLGLTFHSMMYHSLFPVYGYQEWYLQQEDLSQKYREYSGLLRVFQSQEPEQRLTLKAPAHTGSLGTIVKEIPNVMLVMTHRDPVACICSACSLLYTYHLGVSNEIDIPRMAELIISTYEILGKRSLAFREQNPGVICDVMYDELVEDPIGTIRGIYTHFDLPWTEAYESALNDYIKRNKKGKHGKHRYAAGDFGLSEAEIAERMKFYTDRFDLR